MEAAKREIEERLGPDKVAFLRRRAAQRAQRAATGRKEAPPDNEKVSDEGTADARIGSQQGDSPGTGVDSLGAWTGPAQLCRPGPSGEASEQKTVARLRFSLTGEPVGWCAASDGTSTAKRGC